MVRRLDPVFTKVRFRDPGLTDYFFSEVDIQMMTDAQRRSDTHKFMGRISPSALFWSMCPYTYVREDLHKFEVSSSDGQERMELGKAFHKLYLDRAKRCNDLLYSGIKIPSLIMEKNTRKNWEVELASRWPSFMVVDEYDLLSGEVDLVISVADKPVIVDLKFPQEYDLKRWQEKMEKLPGEQYETQLCIYAWIFNKYGYADKPCERVGIAVRNHLINKASATTTKEVYFDYTSEMNEKVGLLVEHLYAEMRALNEGRDSVCSYPLCSKHTKPKRSRKKCL